MADKIIFKDFENLVPMIKDRWTPIYLEHGRLEVDKYSVKWIDSSGSVMAIPSAMVSCILLGPGSTITHAAVVSCSKSNTPVVWIGEDGLYYYATGVNTNERCRTTVRHAELYADKESRLSVCRKMFKHRFKDIKVEDHDVSSLMGIEGNRVRNLYKKISEQFNIEWVCRNTNGIMGIEVDELNQMLNIVNYNLYCICLSAITTMGYIPALGFIHTDGKIPFVYDIADLFKSDISIPVAFETYSVCKSKNNDMLMQKFTQKVSSYGLLQKLPKILHEIIGE